MPNESKKRLSYLDWRLKNKKEKRSKLKKPSIKP